MAGRASSKKKPDSSGKPKSGTRKSGDSRHMTDPVFPDDDGYWPDAVWNLVRWLKMASVQDYAYRLDKEVGSYSPAMPLQAEAAILDAIERSLARIYNEPPRYLNEEQRRELIELRDRAIRLVRHRSQQVADDEVATERAAATAAKKIQEMAKAKRAAPEEPQTPGAADGEQLTKQLRPDQFDLDDGVVVSHLTAKQLSFLGLLKPAGSRGVAESVVCKRLGYKFDTNGRKALGQLAHRTNDKLNDWQHIIELTNGFYCLTKTGKATVR